MKKALILLVLCTLSSSILLSQNNSKLHRIVINSFDVCDTIFANELRVDLNALHFKTDPQNTKSISNIDNLKFYARAQNILENTIYINGIKYSPKGKNLKVLKAGFDTKSLVLISQSTDQKKWILYAHNKTIANCDDILKVFDDNFIYYDLGVYRRKLIDKQRFNDNYVICVAEKKTVGKDKVIKGENGIKYKLPIDEGDTYYQTYNGHFYYWCNKLRENTIIVVDGVFYELDGLHENVGFCFSQSGDHWMAAAGEFVLIDGVKYKTDSPIKDFLITDDGQYAYINDNVIINGAIVANNVKAFQLEYTFLSKWKFKFIADDVFYSYNGGVITDLTDEYLTQYSYSPYWPKKNGIIKSKKGNHVLQYCEDWNYVEIDGEKYGASNALQVILNPKRGTFIWTAVERNEVVLYEYQY